MKSFRAIIESHSNITQDKLNTLQCSLIDISMTLCDTFEKMENNIKQKELILAVGQEKSGKSTLLSYCAFGPEQLCESKVVDEDVEAIVIDQKKLIKESFDVFHIGHDSETTCTKKPQFEFVKSQNLAYGDLVGLLDAQGEAGEFITQLLWQEIFRTAKSVKFLVLLTVNDFEDYERDEYDQELKNAIDYLTKIGHLTNKSMD